MKQTFVTKVLNHILVILGFASAVSCEEPEMRCMYGTFSMDYEVSGKVVNNDSAPIPGIQVSSGINVASGAATVLTAQDGSFFISGTGAPSIVLVFEDIDGPGNGGEFAGKTQEINVSQIKKGDGWYLGKYGAKDVVIELEEKK